MTANVDVHVLHLPDEISIIGKVEHPLITVHHLDGIPDLLYQARINGFLQGNLPYVSFVDPDDQVNLTAFEDCVNELVINPHLGGVYTNSIVIHELPDVPERKMFPSHEWSLGWHSTRHPPIHSLIVFRRSVIEEAIINTKRILKEQKHVFESVPELEYLIFACVAKIAPFKFLDIVGYKWYNRLNGAHKQRCHKFHKYLYEMLTPHKKTINTIVDVERTIV